MRSGPRNNGSPDGKAQIIPRSDMSRCQSEFVFTTIHNTHIRLLALSQFNTYTDTDPHLVLTVGTVVAVQGFQVGNDVVAQWTGLSSPVEGVHFFPWATAFRVSASFCQPKVRFAKGFVALPMVGDTPVHLWKQRLELAVLPKPPPGSASIPGGKDVASADAREGLFIDADVMHIEARLTYRKYCTIFALK